VNVLHITPPKKVQDELSLDCAIVNSWNFYSANSGHFYSVVGIRILGQALLRLILLKAHHSLKALPGLRMDNLFLDIAASFEKEVG